MQNYFRETPRKKSHPYSNSVPRSWNFVKFPHIVITMKSVRRSVILHDIANICEHLQKNINLRRNFEFWAENEPSKFLKTRIFLKTHFLAENARTVFSTKRGFSVEALHFHMLEMRFKPLRWRLQSYFCLFCKGTATARADALQRCWIEKADIFHT